MLFKTDDDSLEGRVMVLHSYINLAYSKIFTQKLFEVCTCLPIVIFVIFPPQNTFLEIICSGNLHRRRRLGLLAIEQESLFARLTSTTLKRELACKMKQTVGAEVSSGNSPYGHIFQH